MKVGDVVGTEEGCKLAKADVVGGTDAPADPAG